MSILNPRYAFLEDDYANPNLNRVKTKVENTSEKVREKSGLIGGATLALTFIPTPVFTGVNWMIGLFISLSADIYCVAMLLILKIF